METNNRWFSGAEMYLNALPIFRSLIFIPQCFVSFQNNTSIPGSLGLFLLHFIKRFEQESMVSAVPPFLATPK